MKRMTTLTLLCAGVIGCQGYWDRGRPTPAADGAVPDLPGAVPDFAPDLAPLDMVAAPDKRKGVFCKHDGFVFKIDRPLQRGKTFNMMVTGKPSAWPMAGVTISLKKPPGILSFHKWIVIHNSYAPKTDCWPQPNIKTCKYPFKDVPVPDAPGPYAVGFLRDGRNYDPNHKYAALRAYCTP